MYERRKRGGFGIWLAAGVFCLLLIGMPGLGGMQKPREKTESITLWKSIGKEAAWTLRDMMYMQFMPSAAGHATESNLDWLMRTQTESLIPLYGVHREMTCSLAGKEKTLPVQHEDGSVRSESAKETSEEMSEEKRSLEVSAQTESEISTLLKLLEQENETAKESVAFTPRTQRVQVNLEELNDYETLVKRFYTIDTNTSAGMDQLNVQKLLQEDISIEKRTDGPQILIYHTHSQETFADSLPGDINTSIVGVGERLTEILQDEYGYQVLHHTGQYDVDGREDAYGRTLPVLETLLKENPTIEVVIDLHRDQMPQETKLVMDLDGRPTARFMFFNGLSRTRQSGDIAYLENQNIDMNLATSFQMHLKCEEYYPGLTRKIYLKGYRYNMHLCPRTMLVELGAQNNTVEEAMNACDPLAHVLDMVLSGE